MPRRNQPSRKRKRPTAYESAPEQALTTDQLAVRLVTLGLADPRILMRPYRPRPDRE